MLLKFNIGGFYKKNVEPFQFSFGLDTTEHISIYWMDMMFPARPIGIVGDWR
jgi:hypothetical protein